MYRKSQNLYTSQAICIEILIFYTYLIIDFDVAGVRGACGIKED